MKIEFESFSQMQFRHFGNIFASTCLLWRGFKNLAVSLFFFVAGTVFFPIKNTRRYKALWLRKLRKTRDELKRRRTNGFRYKGYKSYILNDPATTTNLSKRNDTRIKN